MREQVATISASSAAHDNGAAAIEVESFEYLLRFVRCQSNRGGSADSISAVKCRKVGGACRPHGKGSIHELLVCRRDQ